MNEFVKNFVETSIDFIDLEDWDGLYREWYKKGNKESNSDSLLLNELFEVLSMIGFKDLKDSTYDIRRNIIQEKFKEYILLEKYRKAEYISWAGSVNHLNSRLGVGLIDLRRLFRAALEELDITPESDTFLRARLN